ncbi:hypothetical protein TNCV_3763271 [Trichonephila clavipes]|uniref:Uncharacterized protein n=1 Tax=Trichonephila clavipes TaxID=2585209 RepID=A0A8X7B9T3_TRICX|nr:hypothetical protein TNCV_3763271 [Trichonephila clavipes]
MPGEQRLELQVILVWAGLHSLMMLHGFLKSQVEQKFHSLTKFSNKFCAICLFAASQKLGNSTSLSSKVESRTSRGIFRYQILKEEFHSNGEGESNPNGSKIFPFACSMKRFVFLSKETNSNRLLVSVVKKKVLDEVALYLKPPVLQFLRELVIRKLFFSNISMVEDGNPMQSANSLSEMKVHYERLSKALSDVRDNISSSLLHEIDEEKRKRIEGTSPKASKKVKKIIV